MLAFVHLSDDFLKDISEIEFENYKNIFRFLKDLIHDKNVFFVGNKNYISKIEKTFIGKNKNQKNAIFLSAINKKSSWINIGRDTDNELLKNNKIPVDFSFCSKKDKISDIVSNVEITNQKINVLKNKINEAKHKLFNINLKCGKISYIIDETEKKVFISKILKVVHASDKIIIWDQYIPNNLVHINKNNKNIKKNMFFNDYCNTLKFLDTEIFSKLSKNYNCEILTMNKLEKSRDFIEPKHRDELNFFIQQYINRITKIKSVIYVKKMDVDSWDIKHSRLMLFKDKYDQILSYCVVESGVDFIKKEKKDHYEFFRQFRTRKYTFTPGSDVNFEETKRDIDQINSIKGSKGSEEFSNFA